MSLAELERTLDSLSIINVEIKVDIINHQLVFRHLSNHSVTILLKRSVDVLLPMIIAQFESEIAEKRRQTEVQLKYACYQKIEELSDGTTRR